MSLKMDKEIISIKLIDRIKFRLEILYESRCGRIVSNRICCMIFRPFMTFGELIMWCLAASDATVVISFHATFCVCLTHDSNPSELPVAEPVYIQHRVRPGWTQRSIRIFTVDTLSKLQFYMDIKSIYIYVQYISIFIYPTHILYISECWHCKRTSFNSSFVISFSDISQWIVFTYPGFGNFTTQKVTIQPA